MFSIVTFVLALAAFSSSGVLAQSTVSGSPEAPIVGTPLPQTGTTLSVPPTFSVSPTTSFDQGPGPMTLSCVRTETVNGVATAVPIDTTNPDVIASAGDQCWLVYSIGGGTARVPVTATTIQIVPPQTATSSAVPDEGLETSSSTSNNVDVIVPAVVGSIAGVVVLGLAALLYSRYRSRKSAEDSRTRIWADKNGDKLPSAFSTDKDFISKPKPQSIMMSLV